jgi:nucleotide-binding universal stress UspA family protein
MSYRTILVHVDTSRQARNRVDAAVKLATDHEARVVALYSVFIPEPKSFYVLAGVGEELLQLRSRREQACGELQAYFDKVTGAAGVKGEWHTPDEHPNVAVPLYARHADLAVAGQTDMADPDTYVAPNFVENLIMSAGRPVLVMPYAGASDLIGTAPMIAWDCSRAATRAVHDALPFLVRARTSAVVTVNALDDESASARLPGAEIATVLARHGATVTTHSLEGVPRREIGETLLSQASDLGADLIVAGAYGHMRVAELVLGGVTRKLLQSMTVPVLFSH